MKKAQFTEAEVQYAVDEFSQYMSPRTVEVSGMNGSVTVYGENANTYKPTLAKLYDEDENGILQELSSGNIRIK